MCRCVARVTALIVRTNGQGMARRLFMTIKRHNRWAQSPFRAIRRCLRASGEHGGAKRLRAACHWPDGDFPS
jgi:hypothetical protein